MNERRQAVWALLRRALLRCPAWGMVYAAPEGKPPREYFAVPWPGVEEERGAKLEDVEYLLESLPDNYKVYLFERDDERGGHSWPWPPLATLFDPEPPEPAKSHRKAAGPDCEDAVILAVVSSEEGVDPEPGAAREGTLAGLRRKIESAPRKKRCRYSADFAGRVRAVLEDHGGRMTQTQLLAALGWAQDASTAGHTLSEMVRRGELTKAQKDEYGTGYGLPLWRPDEGEGGAG